MSHELVFYKCGTSLFHKIGDDARLRPNMQEVGNRFSFDLESDKTKSVRCFIDDDNNVLTPIFASNSALHAYVKQQYGSINHFLDNDQYIEDFINDKYYSGHR